MGIPVTSANTGELLRPAGAEDISATLPGFMLPLVRRLSSVPIEGNDFCCAPALLPAGAGVVIGGVVIARDESTASEHLRYSLGGLVGRFDVGSVDRGVYSQFDEHRGSALGMGQAELMISGYWQGRMLVTDNAGAAELCLGFIPGGSKEPVVGRRFVLSVTAMSALALDEVMTLKVYEHGVVVRLEDKAGEQALLVCRLGDESFPEVGALFDSLASGAGSGAAYVEGVAGEPLRLVRRR